MKTALILRPEFLDFDEAAGSEIVIYKFNDYTLDEHRIELRRGTEQRHVEPQVFSLLAFLIRNRDRVVSKDEIIDAVWGGRIVSDSIVNTRINGARRAIGDSGKAQSAIRTIPRRGFRFVADVSEAEGVPFEPETQTSPKGAAVSPDRSAERKPTVAVRPFERIGDDDEGFGIGLADAILTELSRRTGVEVIGRESSFRLSGGSESAAGLRQVPEADYVLTGSVHCMGPRLRVSAALSETKYSRQVWAERYDRDLGNVLAVQDELAHLILTAIRWNMAAHDGERVAQKPDSTVSRADRLSQAAQCFYTATLESYQKAGDLLDAVLEDDPHNAMALGMRAFALFAAASFDVVPMSPEACARAITLADLALEQAEGSDFAHWIRGTLSLNLERDHDIALRHAERALEINPHFAAAARLKGETLCYAGSLELGIPLLEELVATDSRAPANAIILWALALAHFTAGDQAAALDAIDGALLRIGTMPDLHLARAAILSELGRADDARSIIEGLRRRHGGLTLIRIRRPPFKHKRDCQRYLGALRGAGLSD